MLTCSLPKAPMQTSGGSTKARVYVPPIWREENERYLITFSTYAKTNTYLPNFFCIEKQQITKVPKRFNHETSQFMATLSWHKMNVYFIPDTSHKPKHKNNELTAPMFDNENVPPVTSAGERLPRRPRSWILFSSMATSNTDLFWKKKEQSQHNTICYCGTNGKLVIMGYKMIARVQKEPIKHILCHATYYNMISKIDVWRNKEWKRGKEKKGYGRRERLREKKKIWEEISMQIDKLL